MEIHPPKNWQNQRGYVFLKRSLSCSLYTVPLKSLAYCLHTWCGLERQRKKFSGTQDSQTYFLGELFSGSSLTLLKDKGWFLDPLFWSRALHKEAMQCDGNITAAHSQKARNRGPTKTPMLPFRPPYTISFTFLNICSKFQSPKSKSYMKLLFRACSIMPSGPSAVSMWVSPSLLYLSNTGFIHSFPGKYGHCICNWFYCCSVSISLQTKTGANKC